ncbi:MAG: cytochrome c oxidase accessory protein CcoG [Deltaproteobacteria bacterium]|nr:cytochrome c oxidase accessory protein CcoG [Deltaproteobacteria bacterium]
METGKREKLYPKGVRGRFRHLRWAVTAASLGVFFLLPWLTIDGRQALLFDIPNRKFYIFNLIFWPQEVYYLAFLLVFLVIALFLFTAVAGRLWCGYACPQTVFTDIFISIERFIEGERNERIALDKAGFSNGKAVKKAVKHAVWIIFSFATAFAFVSFFVPPAVLIERLFTGNLTSANLFWLGLFTLTTYGDCAFLRELMCLVPCPYGRFQSALFDTDTLIIGYDSKRGEPRTHGKKKESGGDCVDCTLCVQVCPTGIDIRNGLQYECIACAQCIDACDTVMGKLGRPKGLIRYGSLKSIAGGETKVLRPRLVLYAVCLTALLIMMVYKVSMRSPIDLEVLRDRSALFQTGKDGRISNIYTIKAMNMDSRDHQYSIKAKGIKAEIIVGKNPITVKSGEVYQTSLALILDGDEIENRVSRFDFIIEDVEDPEISAKRQSTFLVPETSVAKR